MQQPDQRPLGFGEILDQTFRIIKSHFKTLFLISLFVMTPILVIQALILALSGRDFIFGGDLGTGAFNQIINNIDSLGTTSVVTDITDGIVGLLTIFAVPLISGAIILTVKSARAGGKPLANDMIRGTLSRYWPMLGSSVLIALIAFGLYFICLLAFIFFLTIVIFSELFFGIVLVILLFVAAFLGLGLLLTRFSLYLPAVLFAEVAPGLGKSWRLTRKQTWKFFGIYIVLGIIASVITFIIAIPVAFLGDSILYHILTNISSFITGIIFMVGYAVIYFDASLRQDGSDVQAILDQYPTTEPS
ncbi:hypothetical protein [Gracilibacillus alcaliphilus]|uniref:hypothetical protein n=1 Tax=Gracilibacillus alcaliphilus TaxID=1401441 RepID=UPI00195A8905|nr:hypothetical protein [Gracilibacillus alcaliphilus]MBM7677786.1 hypothetical protein [Gracilibacillus alcaliphilus]